MRISDLIRVFLLSSDVVGTTFIRLTLVRPLEFWILPSFLCSPFNYTLVISADQSMSRFSSNLPRPPRSRVSCGPDTASGGQPLVSSFPVVVPTLVAAMNPPHKGAGSLVPAPSHNPVTLVEPFEPAPQDGQVKIARERWFIAQKEAG